jgi:hypothetical protein
LASARLASLRNTELDDQPTRRAPWLVAGLVATCTVAIVWIRLAVDGVQPYGTDGAEYIEHLARLRLVEQWRWLEGLNLWRLLVEADGAFPAGLHLLTLPIGWIFGHQAGPAAATGALWLLLLAFAVGVVAARLDGRPEAGAVALTALLLVPALHGMATRYYYDLPMTALLWGSAAVILRTRDRSPLRGGLAAGLLLFAACVVKWTAIPLGVIVTSAALAVPLADGPRLREDWRRRLLMAGAVALPPALLVWAYMAGVDGTSSFGHQAHITMAEAGAEGVEGTAAPASRAEAWRIVLEHRAGTFGWVDLAFYPTRLVTSILSPLLALVAAVMGLVWLRRGARGWLLVLGVPLATLAFLWIFVPPLDDRFLVPAVPALAVGAALGWSRLGPRGRRGWAIAALAVGLLVTLDLHFAPQSALTRPIDVLEHPDGQDEATVARGLGAASSVEARGWVRADEQTPARAAFRERLYERVAACRVSCLGVGWRSGTMHPLGDTTFWKYRSVLDALRGSGTELVVIPHCPELVGDPSWIECSPDVVVHPMEHGARPWLHRCLDPEAWELVEVVEDPGAGPDATVWQRVGSELCTPQP